MRSRALQSALAEYLAAAAAHLQGELLTGAEVPFELGARRVRGGGPQLYCYQALTAQFIREREAALNRLPAQAEAVKLLEDFDGLDRYLTASGLQAGAASGRARARAGLNALVEDVFDEQSHFELRPERVQAALERLEQSAVADVNETVLVGTLHGVTIVSPELPLAKGLTIAHGDALQGIPEAALSAREAESGGEHVIVLCAVEQDDYESALAHGRAAVTDLLRALRLFGDGRVTLGGLGWARMGTGSWSPLALGGGGRPHGMLVVTPEQEDELRAFCNLVSRRAPRANELAWALGRFELACERERPEEALTDHLLALRALLEPEGPASGLLAGRLAALCATATNRVALERTVHEALDLEQAIVAGAAQSQASALQLVDGLAGHLRALLRDVICGHLGVELAQTADELLQAEVADEEQTDEPELVGAPEA